jgi:hypothetical protein
MARIGTDVVQKTATILRAPAGLPEGVAAISETGGISLPVFTSGQVITQNIPAELIEKTAGTQYPTYHLYCEKLQNTLREKFRTFSGTATLSADIRVTHDRLEGLDKRIQAYVDALTDVLDRQRGDWGGGLFFTGAYVVTFGAVKHGGKNFIQTAKVTFDVQVSV